MSATCLSPVASIMVPTYRQERVLARAIGSALDQDLDQMEVIVADDASPDGTEGVVATFSDPRLRYHRNPSNIGRVANYRQTLQSVARGKYVLNLDGDDWLVDPTYLRRAVEVLESDSSIVLVFAKAWRYREEEDVFYQYAGQNSDLGPVNSGNELFLRYPSKRVRIPHLTAVYRRDVALSLGFYSQETIGSDTDSLLRLILGAKVAFIDSTVAVWRIHSSNATSSVNVGESIANLACVDSPFERAKLAGAIDIKALRRWRVQMYTELSLDFFRRAVKQGHYGRLLQYMLGVVLRSPGIACRILAVALSQAVIPSRRRDLPTFVRGSFEESTQ